MQARFCVALLIPLLACGSAHAQKSEVCELLTKEVGPVMYLIDQHGAVSKGPLDIGAQVYKPEPRYTVQIPTPYRLVVHPRRLTLASPNDEERASSLKPVKSVCPNAATYLIGYQTKLPTRAEYVAEFVKGLPHRIDESMMPLTFEDPNVDQGNVFVRPKCKFDCRFVGSFVDGRNPTK